MAAHKFKCDSSPAEGHFQIVYCEYCGFVAYNGDKQNYTKEAQETAKTGCPLAPEPEHASPIPDEQ